MQYYKLRVDHDQLDLETLRGIVSVYSSVYAYCIEGGDENPHTHWYLELDSSRAFREKLRKLGLKGNQSYSLKELDERFPKEYIAYMLKEKRFYNKGIPEDHLAEAHDHNNKVVNEIKEKKEKRKSMLVKLKEYVKDKGCISNEKAIAYWVIKYHIEHELLIRQFQIKAYVDTIYLSNCSDRALNNYCLEKF